MISSSQASKLLDHVVYEHVLECIDLDALYDIEQTLWYALGESDVPVDAIPDIARDLVSKALDQVRHDERRDLIFGSASSLHCDLCEREAATLARTHSARTANDNKQPHSGGAS